MPLFSGLPWMRRERAAAAHQEQPKDNEGFTDLEQDFFAQGEDRKAMRKSKAERLSDLEIARRERESGHLEREVMARGDVEDMLNTLKRTGRLDKIDKGPEVKVAFLRNMIDQLKAKQAAFAAMDTVPLKEIKRIENEISSLEDLLVTYGMEIDFDGGPDDGEEITLDLPDEEDEETTLAA